MPELASEKVPPASRYKRPTSVGRPTMLFHHGMIEVRLCSSFKGQSSFDDVIDGSFCSESMLRGSDGACWVRVDELDRTRYLGGYVADIPQ